MAFYELLLRQLQDSIFLHTNMPFLGYWVRRMMASRLRQGEEMLATAQLVSACAQVQALTSQLRLHPNNRVDKAFFRSFLLSLSK